MRFLRFLHRRRRRPEAEVAVRLNTRADALRFAFGEGEDYERFENAMDGSIRRHIAVRLYNAGDGELTDCRLTLEDIQPPASPGYVPVVMAAKFSLGQGEARRVDIVSLSERVPARMRPGQDDEVVLVDAPLGFGYRSFRTCIEPKPREEAYTLLLAASAREADAVQVRCLVYVVQGRLRNLKMERL